MKQDSSAPPLSVEGGSVTAFLLTVLGNAHPSFGKCCSKGLGVLYPSLKVRNFVWKRSAKGTHVFQSMMESHCAMEKKIIKSNTFV